MRYLKLGLPFFVVFGVIGCAGLADLAAAIQSGGEVAAPALPDIPRALAGDPVAISNVASYLLNAGLAAWATWERRQRQNRK